MILFPNHALRFVPVYLPAYRKNPSEAVAAIKREHFHTYTDGIFTTEFDRYCFFHLTFHIIVIINFIHLAAMIWFLSIYSFVN